MGEKKQSYLFTNFFITSFNWVVLIQQQPVHSSKAFLTGNSTAIQSVVAQKGSSP